MMLKDLRKNATNKTIKSTREFAVEIDYGTKFSVGSIFHFREVYNHSAKALEKRSHSEI